MHLVWNWSLFFFFSKFCDDDDSGDNVGNDESGDGDGGYFCEDEQYFDRSKAGRC